MSYYGRHTIEMRKRLSEGRIPSDFEKAKIDASIQESLQETMGDSGKVKIRYNSIRIIADPPMPDLGGLGYVIGISGAGFRSGKKRFKLYDKKGENKRSVEVKDVLTLSGRKIRLDYNLYCIDGGDFEKTVDEIAFRLGIRI